MKLETYRHQLLLVFILGIAILIFTYGQYSHPHGESENIRGSSLVLVWENGQLLLDTEGQRQQHSFQKDSLPADVRPVFFQPIPINHASEELLVSISGIGPVLARRIIFQRDIAGFYDDYEDLLVIKGIGENKAMMIAEYVTFER